MRHSPKQDLSQERLHGLGSEESFVPRCLRREWSSRERRDIEKAAGVKRGSAEIKSNLRVEQPLSYPRSGISQNVPGGNGARGSGAT
jgi:hypothetical protein